MSEAGTVWVAVPFVLAVGALTAPWYLKRRKRRASVDWILVAARVEDYNVASTTSKGGIGGKRTFFVLLMDFSYEIKNETYSGVYRETFTTPVEAVRQYGNYCSLPFYIRYNPSEPSEYFVDPYRDVRGPTT